MDYIRRPKGLEELVAVFGNPLDYKTPEEWRSKKLVRVDIPWYTGIPYAFEDDVVKSVLIHNLIAINMRNVFNDLYKSGAYVLIDGWGGTYSPRSKRSNPKELSTHYFGVAADVNPTTNRYGLVPRQPAIIVDIFEKHGFHWLGRSTPYDGMHFQYCKNY